MLGSATKYMSKLSAFCVSHCAPDEMLMKRFHITFWKLLNSSLTGLVGRKHVRIMMIIMRTCLRTIKAVRDEFKSFQNVMHIIHHEEHTRGVHVAPIHGPGSRDSQVIHHHFRTSRTRSME